MVGASAVAQGCPVEEESSVRDTSSEEAEVIARFKALRGKLVRIRSSNYDISNLCNLRCEGCLYFSDVDEGEKHAVDDPEQWNALFRAEASRGINFAYLAGAEPSLTPERIRVCHEHIPHGIVFTNGSRKIDESIRYRLHVSLWGNESSSKRYRDGSMNSKAFRNYAGDDRAVFVLTINSMNIGEIHEVAEQCAEHGLPLTFSFFSPTIDYNRRQSGLQINKSKYFRLSEEGDMRLSPEALKIARDTILSARQAYPDTVVVSQPYIDWITGESALYELDADGVATNCGNRLTRWHRHYNADLTLNPGKCCSPNIDCKDCRAYAQGLATYLQRFKITRGKLEDNIKWLDAWEYWAAICLSDA